MEEPAWEERLKGSTSQKLLFSPPGRRESHFQTWLPAGGPVMGTEPLLSSPYLAQGEGLGAVPVEGVFERAQPGLSNANLVPQGGLLVRGGVGVLILVDVPHSRAGKDFNGAAAEPGLPQKEKIYASALLSKNVGRKGPARGWQNARES